LHATLRAAILRVDTWYNFQVARIVAPCVRALKELAILGRVAFWGEALRGSDETNTTTLQHFALS